MKAVLFISHGSHSSKTEEEVRAFVRQLKQRSSTPICEYAFLEIAHPTIPEGIDICVEKGAREIIILLNFLNAGRHVDEDIPKIIQDAKTKHPGVHFRITDPVGQHEQIIGLFLDMIDKHSTG